MLVATHPIARRAGADWSQPLLERAEAPWLCAANFASSEFSLQAV